MHKLFDTTYERDVSRLPQKFLSQKKHASFFTEFLKDKHACINRQPFIDHSTGIIFLNNMGVLCSIKSALCDMRTVICYMGVL